MITNFFPNFCIRRPISCVGFDINSVPVLRWKADEIAWGWVFAVVSGSPLIDASNWVSWSKEPCTKPASASITLLKTNISPTKALLKMLFLFPRWDMIVPWRVLTFSLHCNNIYPTKQCTLCVSRVVESSAVGTTPRWSCTELRLGDSRSGHPDESKDFNEPKQILYTVNVGQHRRTVSNFWFLSSCQLFVNYHERIISPSLLHRRLELNNCQAKGNAKFPLSVSRRAIVICELRNTMGLLRWLHHLCEDGWKILEY